MNTRRMNPCKVVTGNNTVMNYLAVTEPRVPLGGGTPKYSVSLIIPKWDTVTIAKIRAAIQAAYEEGADKLRGANRMLPALDEIKSPLRDGDREKADDPAYANAYFVSANTFIKPDVVDANRQPILDERELYSGIIGRASITFYAYNKNGNRGIACGLGNIQKLADGTPLGGRSRAADDFADPDSGEDDFLT